MNIFSNEVPTHNYGLGTPIFHRVEEKSIRNKGYHTYSQVLFGSKFINISFRNLLKKEGNPFFQHSSSITFEQSTYGEKI